MQLLRLLLIVFISWQGTALWATFSPGTANKDSLVLPPVFLLGEHEAAFNELSLEYQTLLLTACEDNMDLAYDRWVKMLEEMEAYSIQTNFDLKGIKMWINVFWAKDGTINHIAYYLKPQSRNVDTRYVTAFLSEFARNYRFPLTHTEKFFHYGSANFPIFPRRINVGGQSLPEPPPGGTKYEIKKIPQNPASPGGK